MHNNYHFFKALVPELTDRLVGKTLIACFSQNKDELILHFYKEGSESTYIKASLNPVFSCLSFPQDFSRTRKNSIDLFPDFIDKKLESIYLYENERAFALKFEDSLSLIFKMHGNRSNIIASKEDNAFEIFRHNFPNDISLELNQLDRPIDQGKEDFFQYDGNYQKLFPTFGKLIKKYLKSIHYDHKSIAEQWQIIQLIKNDLDEAGTFYIVEFEDEYYLSLIELGKVINSFKSAMEAITKFYYFYSKEAFIKKEKSLLLKNLTKKQSQLNNYIIKSEEKLSDIKEKPGYNQIADIIMANLHQIPARAKSVELFNFYTNEMITIPLKEQLSPQKNAENLYRKSKNQQIEIDQLKATLKQKRQELESIEEEIANISLIDDVKDLKKKIKNNAPSKNQQVENRVPYKRFEYNDFEILVGKGARENDELTLKYAKKNDLWLHAKDVTGSHVILKYRSNKAFYKEVIEKAAQLAAFYSKRKTDSLVPVITTPKKFVRKPKGLPAGKVHVDKEETILVSPHQWWL